MFLDNLFGSKRPNMRLEAKQPTSIALGVFSLSLITAIVQIICVPIIQLLAPDLLNEAWFNLVFSSGTMYLVAFPLSLLFFGIGTANPPKKKDLPLSAWFGILAISFTLMIVGNYIGGIVNSIIEGFVGKPQTNAVSDMIADIPTWVIFIVVAVAAPIVEEIVYRKLVIDRLRRYGDLTAIVVSGILFGLIHGNFSQFFYATLLGVVFGIVYVQTGKLRYTIALHMAVNFMGSVYSSEMLRRLETLDLENTSAALTSQETVGMLMLIGYYLFIFVCFIAAPAAFSRLIHHIRLQKPSVKLTALQTIRIWLLNPAVWLLLIMILLSFWSSIAVPV